MDVFAVSVYGDESATKVPAGRAVNEKGNKMLNNNDLQAIGKIMDEKLTQYKILDNLIPVTRIEALEEDVKLLKVIVRNIGEELQELKKAQ